MGKSDTKSKYKIKFDLTLIEKFFTEDSKSVTEAQLAEVMKVVKTVLVKYYSKYYYWFDDLREAAVSAICERRSKFDATKGTVYNYCFTVFRNEIHNRISVMEHEKAIPEIKDSMLPNRCSMPVDALELPFEIERWKLYLTGEKEFLMERIPKKDVIPLIFFLKKFESKRDVQVPSLIMSDTSSDSELRISIKVLYKMLKEIINE